MIYNAVIVTSKVLCGLETLEPRESASRLLKTFQLRGTERSQQNPSTILTYHLLYI